MVVDVSVVIPFYNPGADIDDCIASLLAQTLAPDRFEVLLIDDGSTDGSAQRVDDHVAHHPGLLRVEHIAASGGPARPRNVGIDAAGGRYIQFVDSDDLLAREALERLLDIADGSAADIVVSKISGGGPRGVHHQLFRQTRQRLTLDEMPTLVRNLTVCKMFRRSFLNANRIRFPEGAASVEDQNVCLRAYANAGSIALVSDLVYYFYRRRRGTGAHFGDTPVAPNEYRRELDELFDIVETELASPSTRSVAAGRHYGNEILGRLRGPLMLRYDDAYRRELVAVLRDVAVRRIAPDVLVALPAMQQVESSLLLAGDVDGLHRLAEQVGELRLLATTTSASWQNGRLVVIVDAQLEHEGKVLRLEAAGGGWALPEVLAPGVDREVRRLTDIDEQLLDLDLAVIGRSDGALWSTTHGLEMRIGTDGEVHFGGEVHLDVRTVMGGNRLSSGIWDLRLRLHFAGFSRSAKLDATRDPPDATTTWLDSTGFTALSVTPFWTEGSPALSLDVDESAHPLQDRVGDGIPALDHARVLVIPTARIVGTETSTAAGRLSFVPLDQPSLGTRHCPAELVCRAPGAAVRATVPALGSRSGRWAVWLRLGEPGQVTPRRLPFELVQNRLGRLSIESAS
ncbi:MAG TPA: glycosyltransferase [Mycobacteriales bacterium]|nr:glycosyltransferase [Mycobacteriales bacterium]